MNEGKILLNYIDSQRLSKTAIAKELGISRRTLYQYFDSNVLFAETKEKFEKYFTKKIFENSVSTLSVSERAELSNDVTGLPKKEDDKTVNQTSEPNNNYQKIEYREKYFNLLESHDKRFAELEVTINRLTGMLEAEKTKTILVPDTLRKEVAGV